MKIYTKTGDDGTTGLFSGKRVSKTSSYIEAYGTVDELNAYIGFAVSACEDPKIKKELLLIQHELHSICADLATPYDLKTKVERFGGTGAERLEKLIDELEKSLEPLRQFILAGGCELAARLHLSRTVARRAERCVIAHGAQEKMNAEIVIYLNRLSDLLFVMARYANKRSQITDVLWNQ